MAGRAEPPKKVRLACRRCRVRRIKCDGQVPACSNCARVGEACLDVDSQNSAVLIPRNFAGAARARILWLEDIIRSRLPDVDLESGPKVEVLPGPRGDGGSEETSDTAASAAGQSQEISQAENAPVGQRAALKRPLNAGTSPDEAGAFPEQAHSVAVNLGMLSLHSDSQQKHYLGSSSGLLFTHLVGASPSSSGSPAPGIEAPSSRADWDPSSVALGSQRRYYRSLHRFLRQELPRKEDADVLVQTYLRWVHPEFPVLDPESLCAALEFVYSTCSCPLDDDPLPGGWPSSLGGFYWNGRDLMLQGEGPEVPPMPVIAFILFMVFSIGAVVQVRSRVYEFPPEKFHRAALHFAKDCFSRISLDAIQALVTMTIHGMFTPTAANIWTLIHVGMAHCIEIGIHREQAPITAEELSYQHIKKYVFWTIYSLDRTISSIQGRPLGFRDETFDVKPPQSEVVSSSHLTPVIPPAFAQAAAHYTACQFRLDRIVSDIKLHLYLLPQDPTQSARAIDAGIQQDIIRQKLMDWWGGASALDFDEGLDRRSQHIWHLRLKIRFHTSMILLFQPSQAIRSPSNSSLRTCYENASSALSDYQTLHDIQGIHHDWKTVQNVFAAGATMIYSFWMSADVRGEASVAELSRSLRTCSSLLSIGGEWWPSAKKGRDSFGSIADLTMQKLYTEGRPSKQTRLAPPPNASQIDREPGPHMISSGHDAAPQRGDGTVPIDPALFDWNPTLVSGVDLTRPHAHSPAQWQESDLDPQFAGQPGCDVIPEIEDFLAGFDRADLGWNLNDFEDVANAANLFPRV